MLTRIIYPVKHEVQGQRLRLLQHITLPSRRALCYLYRQLLAMKQLVIGIDSGTQSTKALVMDSRDGKVLGSGVAAYELIPNLPPGAKEQHPHTWRDATASAMRQALRSAKAKSGDVIAIGVSGQQHG